MKLKAIVKAAGAATVLMAGTPAVAYEAGDIIVRGGAVTIVPDERSDAIAIPALGIPKLGGTRAQVNNDTQLGLTATYMLNSAIGIELLAATPFSHDISANLDAAGLGVIKAGSATHLPPTLSVVWYPFASTGTFLPYVGAGVNYTVFFEEDVHADIEAAAAGLAGLDGSLPMSLKLDNSLGLAVQVGVDVAVGGNWHINASVRWVDIDTDATFKAWDGSVIAEGTTVIRVDNVEIDPWIYQLNIGYKF